MLINKCWLILPDGPVGERPPPATNLTLSQEAGGYVLRWQGPSDLTKILYYTVEIKKDGQGEKWRPLTDHRIDTEEASYMSKFVHFITKIKCKCSLNGSF